MVLVYGCMRPWTGRGALLMAEDRFRKLRTALRAQARDAGRFVIDPMAQVAWSEIGRLVDEIEAENAALRMQLRNAERDLAGAFEHSGGTQDYTAGES